MFIPEAEKVTLEPSQTESVEERMVSEGATVGVTFKLIPLEVANELVKQPGNVPPTFTMALTISLFDGVKENVFPFPCRTLFLNQVNVGEVPTFTPEAVKFTSAPEHTLTAEAFTETVGVIVGVTVRFVPAEVAVVPLIQTGKVPPVVTMALITSLFDGM